MTIHQYLKLRPLAAARKQVMEANPYLTSDTFNFESITDLGASANPNTTAVIVGDNVHANGKATVAFNRLNPKNLFGRLQDVVKRPSVLVMGYDDVSGAKTVTLSTLAEAISRSLGLDLDTVSAFRDVDGSQTVNLPAAGGYVDYDITVNSANSLRFRPSATDKIPVRFVAAGKRWQNDARNQDCRLLLPNVPDEFEKGLVFYMPMGADSSSAFRGQSAAISFNAASGFTTTGKVVAGASNTGLSQSETSLKPSALLHMPLAGNLTDLVSGNAMNYQGTVTWPVAGRNGVSMLFGTTTARINPSNSAAMQQLFSGTNDWTVAFDFYGVSTNYWQQIVGCYAGGGANAADSFAIMFYKGQLYTYMLSGTVSTNSVQVNGLVDGKWHRIEINRSANKLRLFVDGVKVNENTLTSSINKATTPFQIGNSNNLGNPCQSYIRALEIHNVALHTEDHIPEWWYSEAAQTTNLVTMLGKGLPASTWKQIWSAVPTVTENVNAYTRWLLVVDGSYCKWDVAARRPVLCDIANIQTEGYTVGELQTLMSELAVSGINTFGFAVALITNGLSTPVVTSVALNYVIGAGNCPTIGWTLPVPNSACGLRGGVGTMFTFGGYNIGRDLTNCKVDLDNQLQGNSEFTIEVDIQRSTTVQGISTDDTILWNCYEGGSQTEGVWLGLYNGAVAFGQFDTTNTFRGSSTSIKILDLLPHKVELAKKGNVLYCFVDGVLAGTVTIPTAGQQGTASFHIGFGRVVHGSTNALTRPFRGYMRDFKIYNYARYTATHDINQIGAPMVGSTALLNGSVRNMVSSKKSLQALLYGVDFTPVFESIGLTKITSESTTTALQGTIVTAINAKLAALNIPVTTSASMELSTGSVSNLYGVATASSSGQNPTMARAIVIKPSCFIGDSSISIDGPVTLHLRTVPAA